MLLDMIYNNCIKLPSVILGIGLILSGLNASAQTDNTNYVLNRTYRTTGGAIVGADGKYWGNPKQVQTQVSYFDGLGKPSQTVHVQGNGSYKDLVEHFGYDNMHRQQFQYLPFESPEQAVGSFSGLNGGYYNSEESVGDPTSAFWTETIYDKSPLGRISEQKAPGVSWGVKTKYEVVNGNINYYYINSSDQLAQGTGYPAGYALTVVRTEDEKESENGSGKQVSEFTDHHGRLVLRRVDNQEDTYYVYDGKGQLRYVLQPEFQTASGDLNTKISLYAFEYKYNDAGLMESKRVPGQGTITMEYYETDMLKYLIDANNTRFYYKYDTQNRQIEMGTGTLQANEYPLVQTQYDNYAAIGVNFDNSLGLTENSHFVGSPKADSKTGLVTRVRSRLLDGGDNWVEKVVFYDRKSRIIQVRRQYNGLTGLSEEQISYELDFLGNVLKEKTSQTTSSITYHLTKSFVYDQESRLLSVTHNLAEGNVQKKSYTHVVNTYNEVGQLSGKSLHGDIQTLSYKYTPRGWLYTNKNEEGQGFLVDLRYNNNGNINQFNWATVNWNGYYNSITYDGSNRLTGLSSNSVQESGMTYDKNGNLKTLNRSGAVTDQLTYSYAGTGNQLYSITDGSEDNSGVRVGTHTFEYDQNGNMKSDGSKNADITYNVLNLPSEVKVGINVVGYIYDGSGTKLKMSSPGSDVLYSGAFEFGGDGALRRIGLEEGQLVRNSSGNYEVHYYLRDHLGNVRMVLKEDGSVLQETEYYAFGLPVIRNGNDAVNKYLYNGKEKQPETGWLDYGTRMYMAEIGRWGVVDRAANLFESTSPYVYGINRPLTHIDPSGDTTYSVIDLRNHWSEFDSDKDQVNLYEAQITRPGYQKQLDQMYFDDLQAFSPWLADAYGIQVNASASGFTTEGGVSAGVAMDPYGIAPFISTGIGAGGTRYPGVDFSLQFTMSRRADTSIPHTGLGFVDGVDIGNSIGLGVTLSESQTASNFNSLFEVDPRGYKTYGIGFGFSLGYGYRRTYSVATSKQINFRKR